MNTHTVAHVKGAQKFVDAAIAASTSTPTFKKAQKVAEKRKIEQAHKDDEAL
jgi:hypothetical protein